MSSVLMVLSAARKWSLKDGTQWPTGFWGEEFAVPHRVLTEAGATVTIATPGGLTPVVDEASLALGANGDDEAKVAELRSYLERSQGLLESAVRLEDVDPAAYDAVFVPGGHGPMQDLAVDPDLARVLGALLEDESKVVCALCHGPAGFLSASKPGGGWLFSGRRLTAFSNAEEGQAGLADKAPWLLQDRLEQGGARFESGPAWAPYVVVDGNLVTGQNPSSSEATTRAVLKELAARS